MHAATSPEKKCKSYGNPLYSFYLVFCLAIDGCPLISAPWGITLTK